MIKLVIAMLFSITALAQAIEQPQDLYWMKVKANNKFERTKIANTGVVIEYVGDDFVTAMGSAQELELVSQSSTVEVSFSMTAQMMDFPEKDRNFHNYAEMEYELKYLATNNPSIVSLDIIGTTYENRNIYHLTVTTDLNLSKQKPAILFTGAHHAREHLSVEMPLMLARYLVEQYNAGNTEIVNLLESRTIHIIPMVNPDGAEHDISTGKYKMWRKNRKNNGDGNMGVDLNRNYGYQWGTGGSSNKTNSDVYMGPKPFSEPETQAIKAFVESNENITILLSYHTFSELILYPWGHSYDSIQDDRAFRVHETMARTMSKWNNYTPQQSSDLYIASGDTTDWSFGEHGIISFTFELDPKSMWSGGFYPGQSVIPKVFQKNINPALYLIGHADNPYKVIEPNYYNYGLNSPLVR